MKYTVDSKAKDVRKTTTGKVYYGIKLTDGRWVNVTGDCSQYKRGHTIDITEPKTVGEHTTLWAFLIVPEKQLFAPDNVPYPPGNVPAPPPPQMHPFDPAPQPPVYIPGPFLGKDTCCDKKTLKDWEDVVRNAWYVANSLEPDDAEARAALVNTAVIAWSHGAICFKEDLDQCPMEPAIPGDDTVPF
jgi:hypothetical protein